MSDPNTLIAITGTAILLAGVAFIIAKRNLTGSVTILAGDVVLAVNALAFDKPLLATFFFGLAAVQAVLVGVNLNNSGAR